MTRTQIIDHLRAGRPVNAKLVQEIIAELERIKALEDALRQEEQHSFDLTQKNRALSEECAALKKKALEAACKK